MNNLSWFLYLADVLPSLASTVVFTSCVVIILWILSGMFSRTKKGSSDYPFHGWSETGMTRLHIPLLSALAIAVASLIPAKETIYLIAGSEAGEAVVTSPEAREILSDIQTIIKQQIKPVAK